MNKYTIKTGLYGNKCYYLNNNLHREYGPAIEYANGGKECYKNGKYHREDGPAIEYAAGNKAWYLNNKFYGYDIEFTNESWQRFIKTLIFS